MSQKEAFLHRDRLVRGITSDGFFRITVVKSSQVVRDAQSKHGLGPLAAAILGQTLTGALLMASTLKGEERLTIRFEGNGPIGVVVAEANAVGAVRGFVGNPQATLDFSDENIRMMDALGNGTLSMAKVLYNEARPVTGTVVIDGVSIQEALAHYIRQSEQVESALLLDTSMDENGVITQAGGILVQALPNAPLQGMVALQQAMETLPRITSFFEGNAGYIDTILHQVGGAVGVKELNRMLVDFFCPCTEDSFIRALSLLDTRELTEMAGKPQELVCHYCNKHYLIPAATMDRILLERKVSMN
jgi:molecular chaperone Hsp33